MAAPEPLSIAEITAAIPKLLGIFRLEEPDPDHPYKMRVDALTDYINEIGIDRAMATALRSNISIPGLNGIIRDEAWERILNSQPGANSAYPSPQIHGLETTPALEGQDTGGVSDVLTRTFRKIGPDRLAAEFFAQVPPKEMAQELVKRNASLEQVATMMRRAASYGYEDHFNVIQKEFEGKYSQKELYNSETLYNYINGIQVDTSSDHPIEAQYPEGIVKQMHEAGIDTSKLAITAVRRGDMELLKLAEKYGINDLPERIKEHSQNQSIVTDRTTPELVDWMLKQPGIDAPQLLVKAIDSENFKAADMLADSMTQSVHQTFGHENVYLNTPKQVDWWLAHGISIDDLAAKVQGDSSYDEDSDVAKHVVALQAAHGASQRPAKPEPAPPAFDASAELTKLLGANRDRLISDVAVALAGKDRKVLGDVTYSDQQFAELFSVFKKRAAVVGIGFEDNGAFGMLDGNTAIMIGNDSQVTIEQTKDIWLQPHDIKQDSALVAKYDFDEACKAFQKNLPRDMGLQDALGQGMDSKWPEVTRAGVHKALQQVEEAILNDKNLSPEQKTFLLKDPRIMQLPFNELSVAPEAMYNDGIVLSKTLRPWFAETQAKEAAAASAAPAPQPSPPPAEPPAPPAPPAPQAAQQDAGKHPANENDTLLKIARQYQDSLSKIAQEEGLNDVVAEKDRAAMARWAFVFAAAHENGMKTAKDANHIVAGTSLDLPEEEDIRLAAQAMKGLLQKGEKITYGQMDQLLTPVPTPPKAAAVEDNPTRNIG